VEGVTSSPATDDAGPGDGPLADDRLAWVLHVESFDAFYAREYSSLVAMAHALTGSRAHAEDVAQEAMLTAYRRWEDVSRLDLPAAWVRRVCANTATSLVRRRVVEARAVLRLRSRPVAVAELDETDSAFWAEVRRLPRRQAQCVALRYVYGCSVAEIAGILGCADGTVKSHLWTARARLADRLGETHDERPQS
jgi:RNA polymerase sigma-70 factor (sigma-E family)